MRPLLAQLCIATPQPQFSNVPNWSTSFTSKELPTPCAAPTPPFLGKLTKPSHQWLLITLEFSKTFQPSKNPHGLVPISILKKSSFSCFPSALQPHLGLVTQNVFWWPKIPCTLTFCAFSNAVLPSSNALLQFKLLIEPKPTLRSTSNFISAVRETPVFQVEILLLTSVYLSGDYQHCLLVSQLPVSMTSFHNMTILLQGNIHHSYSESPMTLLLLKVCSMNK